MFGWFKKKEITLDERVVKDVLLEIHMKSGKILKRTYFHFFDDYSGPQSAPMTSFVELSGEFDLFYDDYRVAYLYADIDHIITTPVYFKVKYKARQSGFWSDQDAVFVSEERVTKDDENNCL